MDPEERAAKKVKAEDMPIALTVEDWFKEFGLDPQKKNQLLDEGLVENILADVSRQDIAKNILRQAEAVKQSQLELEATYRCLRDPAGWEREAVNSRFFCLRRIPNSYDERTGLSEYYQEGGARMGNCEVCFAVGPLGRLCRNTKCASQALSRPFCYKALQLDGSRRSCDPRKLCVLIYGDKTATPFCRGYPLIITNSIIYLYERPLFEPNANDRYDHHAGAGADEYLERGRINRRTAAWKYKAMIPIERILDAMEQDPRTHIVDIIETTGIESDMLIKAIRKWNVISDLHEQEFILQKFAT